MKEPKTEVIRARCEASLKTSIAELASMLRVDPADFIRMACWSHIEKVRSEGKRNEVVLQV